ncbi:MAG: hypothetical protein ACRDL7_15165 [Gaiellaceae bacterium]
MKTMGRWTGIAACAGLAVVGLVYGTIYLTEGWTPGVVSNWAWATLFAGFAGVLLRRGGLRWTAITVCAVIAVVALVGGIIYLTRGFTMGVVPAWAAAALFAVFAGVLSRRGQR